MLADTGPLILAIVTVALIDGRVRSVVQTAVTGSGRLRERGEDISPRDPGHQDANGSYVLSTGKRSTDHAKKADRQILCVATGTAST